MATFDHGGRLERIWRGWEDGERSALGWAATTDALRVLMVKRAALLSICRARPELWSDRRFRSPAALRDLAADLATAACVVEVALVGCVDAALHARLERLVERFTITLRPRRPVALVDLVGFSKRDPRDQLAQLTGLEQALCRAEAGLAAADFGFTPVRTTTGDGFYLWDLGDGVDARLLKATLGVGTCFTFHRVAARMPQNDTFVVGAVTVELVQLMAACAPGQILVGTGEQSRRLKIWEAAIPALNQSFGGTAAGRLRLRAALTGSSDGLGMRRVARLSVRAKHGWTYPTSNSVAAARRAQGPRVRHLGNGPAARAAVRERDRHPTVGSVERPSHQPTR